MATIRIATVKATGKRYVVQNIDFKLNKVRCWGEVARWKHDGRVFTNLTHYDSKAFLLEAVDITEVERTVSLMNELWNQSISSMREKGIDVRLSRSGNSATIYR